MIPASYLFKTAYYEAWGNPGKTEAERPARDGGGPDKGHLVGLARLLASVLPLELERPRWRVRHTA